MSDYYDVGDGLVVSEDGELVECADIDNSLAFIARKRHQAREQLKEYERYIAMLDAVLLRKQQEKRLAYGDTVVSIGSGSYAKTDTETLAASLYDTPLELEEIFQVIAAARGFDRSKLPEKALKAYDDATTVLAKRPWVTTSIARKPAPQVRKLAAGDDDVAEMLEASLEAVGR